MAIFFYIKLKQTKQNYCVNGKENHRALFMTCHSVFHYNIASYFITALDSNFTSHFFSIPYIFYLFKIILTA